MKKILSFIFIVLFCSINHFFLANTYYVSVLSGNDSYSLAQAQNPLTPWQSISKINNMMGFFLPGDSILFNKGEIFIGELNVITSGSLAMPIVISSYGSSSDKPTLTSFEQIASWTNMGGGIYESNTTSSMKAEVMVLDGINYPLGRYPNASDPNGGYITFTNSGSNWIESGISSAVTNWTGADVVIRKNRWIIDKTSITSHSGLNFNFTSPSSYNPINGYGFFIQQDVRTLDQYGEWYFNASNQKLYVYFGAVDPNTTIVKIPTNDYIINATGSYLEFSDLNLQGANKYLFYSDGSPKDNYLIDHCDFSFAGEDAIWVFQLNNTTVQHCTIENINNNAIGFYYGCQSPAIKNNTIRNIAIQPGMGVSGDVQYLGIYSQGPNTTIEQNSLVNIGYLGIFFSYHSNLIKENFIDSFCLVKDDGAGIYTYFNVSNGLSPKSIVEHNIVLHGLGSYYGTNSMHGDATGIYIDDNCDFIDIHHNTVAYCSNSGIYIHNSKDLDIKNNHVYACPKLFFTKDDDNPYPIQNNVIKNNIFFSRDGNDISALFLSYANNIGSIGVFDSNYYINPLKDKLFFMEEYFRTDLNSNMMEAYDLSDWRTKYGMDANAKTTPQQIPFYTINNLGSNRIGDGTFNSGISSTYLWSPNSDHSTSWNTTELDGGCFQLGTPTYAHTGFTVDSVNHSKYYIASFSAKANKKGTIQTHMWMSSNPWLPLRDVIPVKLETMRKEYEILCKDIEDEVNASLMFKTGVENFVYYLDNIEFREADITLTNPDSVFLFEYNNSDTSIHLGLANNYVDVDGNPVSGSITIPAHSSVLLILSNSTTEVAKLNTEFSKFIVYPNPSNGNIINYSIEFEYNYPLLLTLHSIDGKVILNENINTNKGVLNTHGVIPGTYIGIILDKLGNKIAQERIVISSN